MSAFKPLPSNIAARPSLFLDGNAPADALLADATRRVEAARDLASTLSMVGDDTRGIQAKDLAAYALVTEILTSDAAAIMAAMEMQFLTDQVKVVRDE